MSSDETFTIDDRETHLFQFREAFENHLRRLVRLSSFLVFQATPFNLVAVFFEVEFGTTRFNDLESTGEFLDVPFLIDCYDEAIGAVNRERDVNLSQFLCHVIYPLLDAIGSSGLFKVGPDQSQLSGSDVFRALS